jgi:hypothetical protein
MTIQSKRFLIVAFKGGQLLTGACPGASSITDYPADYCSARTS